MRIASLVIASLALVAFDCRAADSEKQTPIPNDCPGNASHRAAHNYGGGGIELVAIDAELASSDGGKQQTGYISWRRMKGGKNWKFEQKPANPRPGTRIGISIGDADGRRRLPPRSIRCLE